MGTVVLSLCLILECAIGYFLSRKKVRGCLTAEIPMNFMYFYQWNWRSKGTLSRWNDSAFCIDELVFNDGGNIIVGIFGAKTCWNLFWMNCVWRAWLECLLKALYLTGLCIWQRSLLPIPKKWLKSTNVGVLFYSFLAYFWNWIQVESCRHSYEWE